MKCVHCGYENTTVVCAQKGEKNSLYRQRQCRKCNRRFTTHEKVISAKDQRVYKPLEKTHLKKPTRYYTVYLAETDEVIASGTSDVCAKVLGMSRSTFYSTVSRTVNGKQRKYDVLVETEWMEDPI